MKWERLCDGELICDSPYGLLGPITWIVIMITFYVCTVMKITLLKYALRDIVLHCTTIFVLYVLFRICYCRQIQASHSKLQRVIFLYIFCQHNARNSLQSLVFYCQGLKTLFQEKDNCILILLVNIHKNLTKSIIVRIYEFLYLQVLTCVN